MKRAIVIAFALFTSTAAVAQDRPPLLDVRIYNVSPAELQARCSETYACSVCDFDHNRCDVFIPHPIPRGWPSRSALIKHELAHCAGKGHD